MSSEEIARKLAELVKEKGGSKWFFISLYGGFPQDKDRLILINYLENHDKVTPSQMEYDLLSLIEEYDMHPTNLNLIRKKKGE